MQIRFLGAAGTVTGSNYLLSDERGHGILVDMGSFQGSEELESLNYKPLTFDAHEVHSIFLTHAHLDHCGRLPILMKHGFAGKTYMTQATRDITEIVLLDAAKIMQHEEDKPVLYTEDDVFDFLQTAEIISYGEKVDLGTVTGIFRDAGHILGSASIEVLDKATNKKLVFSGDLGNSPEDLVKPIEFIESGDTVIMESTYGDRLHPTDNPIKTIQSEINTIEVSGGTLLIPSFSVERTQVLLHRIRHLKNDGLIKKETEVYLDSPMGIRVTDVYKKFPQLLNSELAEDLKTGDPFDFPGLNIIEDHRGSKNLEEKQGAKVIIAGSGMMTGGRILNHAMHYLPRPSTRLLIVGFQAENTTGRKLEEGEKNVEIYGQHVNVAATVTTIHSMSAHADQNTLLDWLKRVRGASQVFLTHGEDGPRAALKEKIADIGIKDVTLPKIEEHFDI